MAHPEASIPKMLAVGAVEAAVPPAASRKGRRYFVGTANPSSAAPGRERAVVEELNGA